MKKLLYLISFLPSFLFAGFSTDNLVATSTFTLRTSTMVINGTTYYWRAGTGNSGECLTTDGAVTPALTFAACGGGSSGTTIRVEDQGAFAVNTSTLNFSLGLLATNDAGEGKVSLNPSSYVGGQSWSDGIADTSITVTYNVNAGTPPEWTYSDDRIETLNDLALPDLDPSRPLKTNGTQVITTGLIDLSNTTDEVTGILPGANLGSGSTHYIQNRNTLQSGATFFVSSGSVNGQISVSSVKFADGTIQISSPNLSGYLTLSSATATYFQIASTPTFMSQSSATANFLTQSSATATYFQIASTPTFMSQSSATANFLTLSSAALTYINQSSSGSFIQNRNSLQSGATFYVSSGTATTFNTTTANVGTLNATTINGSPWGSANLVAYLNGANVLTTNPSFIYFDAFSILYAPSILGTSYMGGAFGAPIVSFDADNSNFVGFISSSVLATDNLYTMPSSSGAVNQVWVLDGVNKFQNKYVNQIMKFTDWFNAEQAKLPTTNGAVITNADGARVPSLLFDAATDESASWSGFLTPYTTTQMSAQVWYTMASATSGNVVHNLQVACASSTYSGVLDGISYGAVSASTITVPSVAGRIGIATMTVLNTNYGCRSGDMFLVKYNRDANAAADTASGDLAIRKILIYEP